MILANVKRNKIDNCCKIKCEHLQTSKNSRIVHKLQNIKCNKVAGQYYYFDGANKINLCTEHAKEYKELNLTICNID